MAVNTTMTAQSKILLPILLIVSLSNLIVCSNEEVYNEGSDLASNMDSNEHRTQQLTETTGIAESSLRKLNASYRSHEQRVESSRSASQSYNQENGQQNNSGGTSTDSHEDKLMQNLFFTNFGAGTYLFKNTAPFNTKLNVNTFADQMIGDQPDSYSYASNMSSSDKEFFKVQKSANGKSSPAYNRDFIPKRKTQTMFQGSNGASSNNKNFENRYQTHSPARLHGTNNDKVEPTPLDNNRRKDYVSPYTVDPKDCAEGGAKTGKPFCTQLRNYPNHTDLEELIKSKFSNLESLFGEDLLSPQINTSHRMKNVPIEEFLCESSIRVIYPQSYRNKDYNWRVIINTEEYKQGIRIEECINEGSVCGENLDLKLPYGYKATCRQNYIFRSLVALANQTIIQDDFKIPSCCKCVVTGPDV